MNTRLFFHNNQDKNSTQILNTLETDVIVYDVFGKDKHNLPSNIKISSLPYLVDKFISLDTQSPYKVGTVSLNFSCRDHQDNILQNENCLFYITINNNSYNYQATNGTIPIQLNCPNPATIDIKIEADKCLPFETSIGVN